MESTFTNHIILGNLLTFSMSAFSSAKWQEQYLPQKVVVCIHVLMCRSIGQCLAQQVLKKCQLILSSIPLNLQRISSWSKAELDLDTRVLTPGAGPLFGLTQLWDSTVVGNFDTFEESTLRVGGRVDLAELK